MIRKCILILSQLLFINRAHETANEVRRVTKQLKECQQLAALYNSRERLFGMPVTNVRYLPLSRQFSFFLLL